MPFVEDVLLLNRGDQSCLPDDVEPEGAGFRLIAPREATDLIDVAIEMAGRLEYVFNTPSAHRVRHASNLDYLDENDGGVLVVFDRLFGTYVAERADEPCRFGLVTPTRSRNPFVVEPEHWASLARDVATSHDVWTAIRFVLPPPGWCPDNQGETTEESRRRSLVTVRTDA